MLRWTVALTLALSALGLGCRGQGEEDIRKANVFFKNGDLDRAESAYTRALEAAPSSEPALEGLGNVAFERGDFRGAMTWYGRAIEAEPKAMNARHRLAIAATELGDLETAVRALEGALALDAKDVFALHALGGLQQKKGDLAQAEALQTEVLRLDDKHRAARLALASIRVDQGRWAEAERELAQLQAAGAHTLAEYGFARMFARRADWAQAAARLETVLGEDVAHPRRMLEDPAFEAFWATAEGAPLSARIQALAAQKGARTSTAGAARTTTIAAP